MRPPRASTRPHKASASARRPGDGDRQQRRIPPCALPRARGSRPRHRAGRQRRRVPPEDAGIDTRVDYFTAKLAAAAARRRLPAAGDPRQQRPRPRARHSRPRRGHGRPAWTTTASRSSRRLTSSISSTGPCSRPSTTSMSSTTRSGRCRHLFAEHGMAIQDCEHLEVHGGSLRVTVRKGTDHPPTARVAEAFGSRGLPVPDDPSPLTRVRRRRVAGANRGGRAVRRHQGLGKFAGGLRGGRQGDGPAQLRRHRRQHDRLRRRQEPGQAGQDSSPGSRYRWCRSSDSGGDPPDVLAVLIWNLADEVRSQLSWFTGPGASSSSRSRKGGPP